MQTVTHKGTKVIFLQHFSFSQSGCSSLISNVGMLFSELYLTLSMSCSSQEINFTSVIVAYAGLLVLSLDTS